MNLTRAIALFGRLFPRNTAIDSVATTMRLDASPQEVWEAMLFYEEVPHRPNALLRAFLPAPISTEGDKMRVGSTILCCYEGGNLEKRITVAEPARRVGFDVLVQRLGIESCISMTDGSYEIRPRTDGAEIVLTTRYRGHVRPRFLARLFERFLSRQMHHYILSGMIELLAARSRLGSTAETVRADGEAVEAGGGAAVHGAP